MLLTVACETGRKLDAVKQWLIMVGKCTAAYKTLDHAKKGETKNIVCCENAKEVCTN